MPFTFAHPAIMLNQKNNRYFDFTALIIGTMAPDFEYFINFRPISIVGHTLLGQFYFNLPLILIIAFLYHRVLKTGVIDNLPKALNIRYDYLSKTTWEVKSFQRLWIVAYSAILGAFTHIFWDSFTHKHGFFVDRIAFLSSKLSFLSFEISVYKILQHGSTLLGFLLIFVFLIRIMDKNPTEFSIKNSNFESFYRKLKFWGTSLFFAIIFMSFIIISMDKLLIGSIIISFINSSIIGVFISSVIYKF